MSYTYLPTKRSQVPRHDERASKRPKHNIKLEDDSHVPRASGSSALDPIDLTEGQDEPMLDVSSTLSNDELTDAGAPHATGLRPEEQLLHPPLSQQGRTATSSPERSPNDANDVCFGLLCLEATLLNSADTFERCTPVSLRFQQDIIELTTQGDRQKTAMLVSKPLWCLVNKLAVTLKATICGKKPRTATVRQVEEFQQNSRLQCRVRIVVNGPFDQNESVAQLLGDENLFLQHPSVEELGEGTRYFNPQYLLAPGDDMPALETLPSPKCCSGCGPGSESMLDELQAYERSQIFRVFDTAFNADGVTTITQSARLMTQLKRHQLEALTMMVEKEAGIHDERAQFPCIWTPFTNQSGITRYKNIVTEQFDLSPDGMPPPVGGGIIADEMGLGKTLSCLSLICHSLDSWDAVVSSQELTKSQSKATLIVAPKSTLYNWEKQIQAHIHSESIRYIIYYGPRRRDQGDISLYDIVITTYDTLMSDRNREEKIYEIEWARVILDEAHKIRNRYTRNFHNACAIHANSRWCLTGTPIQNRLDDFGSLLTFIGIPPFQSHIGFQEYIEQPIKEGKKHGIERLKCVVAATCIRRTKTEHASVLKLPQKNMRVERIEMSRGDRALYDFFKRCSYLTAGLDRSRKRKPATNILELISVLRHICNHGEDLLPESALAAWQKHEPITLTSEMLASSIKRCVGCDREMEELDPLGGQTLEFPCKHLLCESCLVQCQSSPSVCTKCRASTPGPDSQSFCSFTTTRSNQGTQKQTSKSPKIEALLRNIGELQTSSHHKEDGNVPKCFVFTYWTKMLDKVGLALRQQSATFQRIDGRSSLSQRRRAMATFENDPDCNVMLASIGAAGEGIDLTAACSVHILEPQWNPMAEAQAIDRIHRIGQKNDVEVVRYIVSDSIENVCFSPRSIFVMLFANEAGQYVQWIQRHKLRMIEQALSPDQIQEDDAQVRWMKLLTYLE